MCRLIKALKWGSKNRCWLYTCMYVNCPWACSSRAQFGHSIPSWTFIYNSSVAVCFCWIASVGAQSHGCPVFGTDQSTGLSRSTEERVFLNFEAPSQCQGTVASWSFCHYRSEENDNSESSNSNSNSNNINGSPLYGAEFLVFRRSTTTSNIYELVAESKTSNLLPSSSVSDFSCLTVEASQSFEIQENDVVGACVWNQGTDVRPLYVVGDTNDNSANQRLYHYGGSNDCTNSQLQNISTTHNDFQQKSEWKLHLYANTGNGDFWF